MKRIELKVSIQCQKCKTEVLKAVTKISGIDQVSMDGEKGTLTVIGDVDPVIVATRVKKTGKLAEIISVGPPKKPEAPKPPPEKPLPPSCGQCQLVALSYVPHDETGQCSIL